MDTLAVLIHSLFAQAYREHPAPPLMKRLLRFLQQSKLYAPACKNAPHNLQESADCAMIPSEIHEKRKNTHG